MRASMSPTRFWSGAAKSPTIDVSGYNAYLLGFETSLPWDRAERTWTAATTATKLWGNHTLKVGGDIRVNRFMLDQVTHPRGSFLFRGATTAIPTDSAAQNGYANALAAFMLDLPQRIDRVVGVSGVGVSLDEPKRRRHKSVLYVHDKWQCGPTSPSTSAAPRVLTPVVGFHGKGGMSSTILNKTLGVAATRHPGNLA